MSDHRPPLDSNRAEYGQADVLGDHLANADQWWHELERPGDILASFDLATIIDALTKYCRYENRALIVLEPQDVAILWGLIGDRLATETLADDDAKGLADLRNRLIDALLGPPLGQDGEG